MSEKNGRRVSMVSTTTVQEQQQLYRPLCMTEVNVTHRFVEPWVWHFGRRHLCFWDQKLARDIYKTCVISRPLEVKEKLTFCILNQFILDKMLQVKTGCWSRTESVPCWHPSNHPPLHDQIICLFISKTEMDNFLHFPYSLAPLPQKNIP